VGLESAFWNTSSARRLQDLDLKAFVDHLVERTLAGLKRAKCESGSQQVLLAPRVSASVLDALLAPAVSALSIQKKRSPLFNKVGQEVFSDQVTVIDDPTLEAMFGSRGFDDEGVRTRRKNVIERGVFKTPLYDTWTARVDETESTGNAVRVKISSMPEPGPLNLILEPGDKSFESLVQEVRKGLVVYGVIGEWLSDYTRGYLNATIVNADCVIDGEVKGAIVSGMLSGDFYEMLRLKLIAKSRELNNVGVVYAPALLLDEVKVTL
ncbi:MAG: metallopeptidase TldD-related protein, partial [Acidilobaceae archaeon]